MRLCKRSSSWKRVSSRPCRFGRFHATKEEFEALAGDLEAVWSHPDTDARLKKRIVGTLIEEVMVDVDGQTGEIVAVVDWKGGVHTELRIPRRRRGYSRAHTPKEIVEAVRVLVRICSD